MPKKLPAKWLYYIYLVHNSPYIFFIYIIYFVFCFFFFQIFTQTLTIFLNELQTPICSNFKAHTIQAYAHVNQIPSIFKNEPWTFDGNFEIRYNRTCETSNFIDAFGKSKSRPLAFNSKEVTAAIWQAVLIMDSDANRNISCPSISQFSISIKNKTAAVERFSIKRCSQKTTQLFKYVRS